MAENIVVKQGAKEEMYQSLFPQIEALIEREENLIANMGNIAAVLKQTFHFFWVGFYIVKDEQLVLAPFQGPVACTRISYGKGVCGTAWKEKKTIIVPNVDQFPGHIACNSASKSEIVIPVIRDNEVKAILDIDSDSLNDFDFTDQSNLEKICALPYLRF